MSDHRNYSLEVPGHNIPCDLHMEHLNRVCKQAIQGIGAKKRKESVVRIGKTLGQLAEVTTNFDKSVLKPSNDHVLGHHKCAAATKDQIMVINKLLNHAWLFTELPQRSHQHFKTFTTIGSIFSKVNKKKWIQDNIPKQFYTK